MYVTLIYAQSLPCLPFYSKQGQTHIYIESSKYLTAANLLKYFEDLEPPSRIAIADAERRRHCGTEI